MVVNGVRTDLGWHVAIENMLWWIAGGALVGLLVWATARLIQKLDTLSRNHSGAQP